MVRQRYEGRVLRIIVLLRFLLAAAVAPAVIIFTNAAFRSVCKDVNFKRIFKQVWYVELQFKVVDVFSLPSTPLGQALIERKLHFKVLVSHLTCDKGSRNCKAAQTLHMLAGERPLIEVPLIETLIRWSNYIRLHVVNLTWVLSLEYVELISVIICVAQTAYLRLGKTICIK